MPDKITLVRKDGSTLDATREQADRLALLGYAEQTPEQNAARLTAQAKDEYYNSLNQKLTTGIEGGLAGLTFGASDYLLGDDETKARAEANPGTRMGSEVLGALLPLVMTGGTSGAASIAEMAPTALLSRGAGALASKASGALGRAAIKGAVEGAVYGGTSAADHAYLDGDPLTAETIVHGIGWGVLFGAGLGTVGGKLEQKGAEAAVAGRPKSLGDVAGHSYQGFRSEVSGLQAGLKESVGTADAMVKSTVQEILRHGETSDLAGFGANEVKFGEAVKQVETLYGKATKAAQGGKFKAAQEAADAYTAHVNDVAAKLGVDMPNVGKPVQDLLEAHATLKELNRVPQTVEQFANLSPSKAERVFAALDKAQGYAADSTALKTAVDDLSASLGVTGDTEPLRQAWRTSKSIYSQAGEQPASEPSVLRRALGYALGGKAYVAARASGFGHMGAYAGYRGVKDLVTGGKAAQELTATRASAISRIKSAAASFMSGSGKAVRAAAPFVEPLSIGLFGQKDDSTKDRQDLAKNRAQEIYQALPTLKDTVYRNLEPLAATQPNLVPAMHKYAIETFSTLADHLPKSNGVISGLKNIGRPSAVEAAVLSKQLAVLHDPVGEAERMLLTGQFDTVKSQALRDYSPATWQMMRLELLTRLTNPEVNSKLTYRDQVGASNFIGIPIISSMTPQQIATSQQIFVVRNQPLKANPTMGQGGGLPNPQDNVNATQSMKSTAR